MEQHGSTGPDDDLLGWGDLRPVSPGLTANQATPPTTSAAPSLDSRIKKAKILLLVSLLLEIFCCGCGLLALPIIIGIIGYAVYSVWPEWSAGRGTVRNALMPLLIANAVMMLVDIVIGAWFLLSFLLS